MSLRAGLAVAVLAGCLGLGGCAASVPPAERDPIGDFRLPTADGDTLTRLHFLERGVAFLFVDPTCGLVQDASQPGGLFRELETNLRDDRGSALLMVASSAPGTALRAGDLVSWQKEARLASQILRDTTGLLARRAGVRRLPWAVVVGADGKWRYDGPAEAMDDSGRFVVEKALRRASRGLSTPRAPEEGDGCVLEVGKE